jgi:transposase
MLDGKYIEKGSIIVMDNTKFHKRRELEKLARDSECSILFLPAYSPDLNPIEQFWSWLKRKLRETLSNYASLNEAVWVSFRIG